MPGRTLQLGRPEVAAVIDEGYAQEPDGWRKRRLLAVKLAAKGEYTSAEVAELCGIARSHLFVWLNLVREGGLDALLERGKPGPKEGTNQVHATLSALRERMGPTLRRYWEDAKSVLRLIGRDWFLAQLNATRNTQMSV